MAKPEPGRDQGMVERNRKLNLVFALTHAAHIRAVVDSGDDALRSELARWEPAERATMVRALAEIG